MANRFISSTGSSTSPYDTWAKAATTLALAISGSANGDILVVDAANPPADITANTTWTFVANVSVIASTNSGTATVTPTTMGTTTWLGNSGGTSYTQVYTGAFKVYFYGITFRSNGANTANFQFNAADGGQFEFENCIFWDGVTNAAQRIDFGGTTAQNGHVVLRNCTFRFQNAAHSLRPMCSFEMIGGSISNFSSGVALTTLMANSVFSSVPVRFSGVDLSLITGTLVASQASQTVDFIFERCRFGAGVTPMATQSPANKSSGRVWVLDCSDGVSHGLFGYYDAFGQVESDTGTFLTAGAAGQSWRITTTANCSFATPFVTPWISAYKAAAAAATYKLELLRNNGTASAYTDAQVWGEFSVKDNSGFTNSDIFNDRQPLADWAAGTAGTAQTAGIGTGSWTISSSNSPASFVVDSGSAITQAENGDIRARIVVGQPSVSLLFVDPQIRT